MLSANWKQMTVNRIKLKGDFKLDRKGNDKVSKCKLKKYLLGKKQRKTSEFRYSMTITIRLLVVQPIKMQDLH